jgi:hypothetical protein
VNGGKAIRSDATATIGEPRILTISHQKADRSFGVVDRHLVRFDETISGTSPQPDVNVTVQLVIEMPRDVATLAQVTDVKDRLVSFLNTSGYLAKVLNNEP